MGIKIDYLPSIVGKTKSKRHEVIHFGITQLVSVSAKPGS